MTWTRRDFLKTSAATAGALAAGPALADFTALKSERQLRILILGGTRFLGPATVDVARARGHHVTLFNRGVSNTHLYPDLPKLKGDRFGDLASLATGEWDVCIDNSGYVPGTVTEAAELLHGRVGQYIFISTISVFADFSIKGMDETAAVGTLTDEQIAAAQGMRDITAENYGPLKALCEQANTNVFGEKACNIRPGLIVGPMDRSDRFTYWPVRVARGGEVLAPGTPDDPTQLIDVRDLAEFIVLAAERGLGGTYNCTSPSGELTMGEMLETCRRVSGSDASFTWADADFLAAQEVAAWTDMPVWVPLEGEEAGHPFIDVRRAVGAGLTFRPISETVRGTLDWWATVEQERKDKPMRAGVTAEREAEVLAAWHEQHG
ncbi:twin-arginine translocation signal domain-containing protein [bacterium]|nr:twin-arginine translocation signal domain-containing protein [bacterium]